MADLSDEEVPQVSTRVKVTTKSSAKVQKMLAAAPANHQKALDFFGLGQLEHHVYAAPVLFSLDAQGKYRSWQIFVAVEHGGKYLDPNRFLNREALPAGAYATYWTVSGQEGTSNPVHSARTEVTSGKNLGKKNATTAFTQALLDAASAYEHKVRKGHVLQKAFLRDTGAHTFEELAETARDEYYWRVYPMRIHDVNKNNRWAKIKGNFYVQPKLDGILFLAVSVPPLASAVEPVIDSDNEEIPASPGKAAETEAVLDGYSPTREEYTSQPHILAEARELLRAHPGLYLVGELWRQGMPLQDISGAGRRGASSSRGAAARVFFNVFDCFRINEPEWPIEKRRAFLEKLFAARGDGATEDPEFLYQELLKHSVEPGASAAAAPADATPAHWIRLLPQWTVADRTAATALYQRFLQDGLEGAVLRLAGAPYEFGVNKEKRSAQTLKWKPRPDDEWPLVGFTEGVGKEKGAVVWICAAKATTDPVGHRVTGDLSDRKFFTVTPNMDYARRQAIFARLCRQNAKDEREPPAGGSLRKLYGALYTVQYSILSKDNLPQQPKGLRFRDPAVEGKVQKWAGQA